MEIANKKIALVHDYLLGIGGAERVLKVLHEMFPGAPIYTVVYDKGFVGEFLPDADVRGSFLQNLPGFLRRRYKYFSLLIPSAVEHLDLSQFDVVLSSSSAFCKGVITRPDTIHISYCHTPTRFLWDWTHEYSNDLSRRGSVVSFLGRLTLHFLRIWDRQASSRVDYFIANSKNVAARIKKYYDRDAKVIYPPCSLPTTDYRLQHATVESRAVISSQLAVGYFLIVSQLRPYKQIDIAIEAFKKLGFPLVVVGEGDDKKRLVQLAKGFKNIRFVGYQDDSAIDEYYKNCKAFIFPGEEDFGMTIVEAMSYGKPVLALSRGGAKEIAIEGITGEFFGETHAVVLADGLRRLLENYKNYGPLLIRKRAEKFSDERFRGEMLEFINECCKIEINASTTQK